MNLDLKKELSLERLFFPSDFQYIFMDFIVSNGYIGFYEKEIKY